MLQNTILETVLNLNKIFKKLNFINNGKYNNNKKKNKKFSKCIY